MSFNDKREAKRELAPRDLDPALAPAPSMTELIVVWCALLAVLAVFALTLPLATGLAAIRRGWRALRAPDCGD